MSSQAWWSSRCETPIVNSLCERRTAHIAVSVERSRRMLLSTMSWQSSARYIGALSDRHWNWKTRTPTLNWTRCWTGDQCRCRRIGVMQSRRRASCEPVRLVLLLLLLLPLLLVVVVVVVQCSSISSAAVVVN